MLNWIISMLSAHISSRMLSLFMASYPHGKTHQGANEANWGVKKKKNQPYFSYFFLTGNDGKSQWTDPKLFHSETQWSSSAQISVCLAELAADIKDYWIFPKTSTVGVFEIWHGRWKAPGKRGGSASNVSSLRVEMNLVLSGQRRISKAVKENRLALTSHDQRTVLEVWK